MKKKKHEEELAKVKKIIFARRFAETIEGRRENSTLYVIDDYLYVKERDTLSKNIMFVKCQNKKCRGRVQLEIDTLRVAKNAGEHSCNQWMDPDRKAQIQMESKMKHLAATTGDSFRKIYDVVSIENPMIAARIDYPRIEATMRWRRNKTTPKVEV